MRNANRRDEGHAQIVADLKRDGFSVADCSRVGNGYPDLHIARNGLSCLVECKTPKGRKTALERRSQAQIDFAAQWKAPIITAYNSAQIISDFNVLLVKSTK